MEKDVQDVIKRCAICQMAKSETLSPRPLHPIAHSKPPIGGCKCGLCPWLTMDTREQVFHLGGGLLVFQRWLTSSHATHIVDLHFKEGVMFHGIQRSIVPARDTKFLSHFWVTLWKTLGTKLMYSTTCHPQTDGQTEVTNRTLGVLLRALIKSNLKSWNQLLAHAEFAYNQAPSKATSLSPFKVVYRVEPLSPLDLTPRPTDQRDDVNASKSLQEIQEIHEKVKGEIE